MRPVKTTPARMAELVDALVSNTSGLTSIPVRSRFRAQKKADFPSAFFTPCPLILNSDSYSQRVLYHFKFVGACAYKLAVYLTDGLHRSLYGQLRCAEMVHIALLGLL